MFRQFLSDSFEQFMKSLYVCVLLFIKTKCAKFKITKIVKMVDQDIKVRYSSMPI